MKKMTDDTLRAQGYLRAIDDVLNFLQEKGIHIAGIIKLYDEYIKNESLPSR